MRPQIQLYAIELDSVSPKGAKMRPVGSKMNPLIQLYAIELDSVSLKSITNYEHASSIDTDFAKSHDQKYWVSTAYKQMGSGGQMTLR